MMNRRDVANLTFKVVGLYCFIRALPHLSSLIVGTTIRFFLGAPGSPKQENWGWLLAGEFLSGPAVLAAMGLFLLMKSRRLAERVFPEPEPQGPPAKILAVHALTFSVVGLFVIADSLPQTLGAIVSLPFNWEELTSGAYQIRQYIVVPLLQLIFGLGLLFGSHGLVRLWSQLRYAGIREKLGLCTACGYDLTGNTSGVCPECGTATPGARDLSN